MTLKKPVLYALAAAGLALAALVAAIGGGGAVSPERDVAPSVAPSAAAPASQSVASVAPANRSAQSPAAQSPAAQSPAAQSPAQSPAESVFDDACCRRVFLAENDGVVWGTLTRWNGGWLTAAHVLENGGEIVEGPDVKEAVRWPDADVAFLGDAAPDPADLAAAPKLEGRVTLRGYPGRSATLQTIKGLYYTYDDRRPGEWIRLDPSEEPVVAGFSGGGVFNADGELVAIIQGESSIFVNGALRHMARVIPLRALAQSPTAVVSSE